MAFFQFPHPWDPRYALPGSVRAEPPGRGALVTKGLRRGTIDTVRTPRGRWATPGYVMSESGQGAITTAGLPRRFVDAKAPDYLARSKIIARRAPVKRTIARGSLSGTVFDKRTLGDVASYGRTGRDPFREFGARAADAVTKALGRVTPDLREKTLKQIFDAIDPMLWEKVAKRGASYEASGDPSSIALKRAISDVMTDGLVDEIVELGRGGKPGPLTGLGSTSRPTFSSSGNYIGLGGTSADPRIGPRVKIMGLDMVYKFDGYVNVVGSKFYKISSNRAFKNPYRSVLPPEIVNKLDSWARDGKKADKAGQAFELWTGRLGKQTGISGAQVSIPLVLYVGFPNSFSFKDWDKQKTIGFMLTEKPIDSGILGKIIKGATAFFINPLLLVPTTIETVAEEVPEAVKDAVKDAASAVKDVVGAVAGAACDVIGSDVGALAVVGTAAATGTATAGAAGAGVSIGRGVCGSGQEPPPPPPPSSFPIWPIAVAGAGVLLLIMGLRE